MIVRGPACGCPLLVISDMLKVRAASLVSTKIAKSADTAWYARASFSRGNQPSFARPGG